MGPLKPFAQKALSNNWINPKNKRIFNNAQVSDHFAIIPTGAITDKLNEIEYKIYDMVCRRFIAIFYPPAEYDVTIRISTVGKHNFKTEGKVLAVPGWLEVVGKSSHTSDVLPALSDLDGKPAQAELTEAQLKQDETRPPARYTEATLLGAMETAGKLVEDEEHADAMKQSGLGTPATRAAIIDHLIYEKYLIREGRELMPTSKAQELIAFLQKIHVETLTSPSMTGEWEHKLLLMEQGKLNREDLCKALKNSLQI